MTKRASNRRLSTLISAAVVAIFLLCAIAVWCGLLANDWWRIDAEAWQGASGAHWFGTNALGQDVFARGIAAIATAFEVGGVVALLAVPFGALLGGIAGINFRGWADRLIVWMAGVIDAVPFLLFAGALAIGLREYDWGLQAAMLLTFWTTTMRVVRAEVVRLDKADFVLAAKAIGQVKWRVLVNHLLPNASHVVLVQLTIVFVAAIKTEVVLSFLGFGSLQRISWGSMIAESTRELGLGHLNSFLTATMLLSLLVLALTILADAAQRRFDVRVSQ